MTNYHSAACRCPACFDYHHNDSETRDIRLSVAQIKILNAVLMLSDASYMKNETDVLLDMFLDSLNSDPETLHDFTD